MKGQCDAFHEWSEPSLNSPRNKILGSGAREVSITSNITSSTPLKTPSLLQENVKFDMATQADFNEDAFFERFKGHYPEGYIDDDDSSDMMALIVMDDVDTETVNEVLTDNLHESGAQFLWLADTYDTLHDFDGGSHEGTNTPIDPGWRSPFIGKTLSDAIAFIRNAPKPPKPLNKTFCAVLEKHLYEEKGHLLICKAVDEEDEPQTIPLPSELAGTFFVNFERENWDEAYQNREL